MLTSGMVVNTIAEWDEQTQTFVLTTPTEGAKKNWISQVLEKQPITFYSTIPSSSSIRHQILDFKY